MKNSIPILCIIIFFQSCVDQSQTNTSIDLRKKVESGLTTPVYIKGDSTWSIEERMKHYGVPGVSIAVIKDGEIVWAKGYGVMDKESKVPVTKETLFQASALSIPVTTYGALRLVEQKKVALDKNINNYLQSWKVPENEFTKEKKVTIRNLLNHSAGIYPLRIGGYGYSINEKIPTLVEILNGTYPAKTNPITVSKVPEESVRFEYEHYMPIQQMMLDVENKTFPELMHELVLQPLEMNNSSFDQSLTTEQLKKAATAYLPDGSAVEGKRHRYPAMAAFGLWTTAEDYAKFITSIQQTIKGEPSKGLSKDLTALMGMPQYGVRISSGQGTIGLGFQLQNRSDEIYLRHHGWNEGFYSEVMAHRDKGYGVVVLTNSNFPAFNAEVIRSVAKVYEWDHFVPIYTRVEAEPYLINNIKGRYLSNGRIVEVFQKDNQLFYKNILREEAEELIKISDSSFIRRKSTLFMQFKPNPENKTLDLQFVNSDDGRILGTFVKMNPDQKEPIEFLIEGDFEKALEAYKTVLKANPNYPTASENYLRDRADTFFQVEERIKLAQNTYKVNMMLYPNSYRVYEDYAKACRKLGEIDLAIENYAKSLELNPQNNNARHKLEELQNAE